MNIKLKRLTLPLKTVFQPMSPDDFFVTIPHKMNLVLSYDFQLRKQGGKSFFLPRRPSFFRKNLFRKVVSCSRQKNGLSVEKSGRIVSGRKV